MDKIRSKLYKSNYYDLKIYKKMYFKFRDDFKKLKINSLIL